MIDVLNRIKSSFKKLTSFGGKRPVVNQYRMPEALFFVIRIHFSKNISEILLNLISNKSIS